MGNNKQILSYICLNNEVTLNYCIMKDNQIITPSREFKGYEEARKQKDNSPPVAITEKEVKAALNRINPDEHSMDRG